MYNVTALDELSDIAGFAVTAASLSTQISGGIPSIPALQEVTAACAL